MKKHNQRHLEEVSYEAPSANTLDILSEGLLCVSFGDANQAGKDLTEDNVWDL